ncbi:hypothetical protein U6A24_13500 [Aquimarina gracilis]|uniref:Uncharacterized protein n=1 Tax=Aquimarina gracilis TaxID=874422 RepID=A0ABU5ZXA1_9FLAO|nr:hypothetical protein [Aquimarina gracilis]MEB3346487.1 hypothetical protein [Aquimarina gracilis]
MFKPNLHLRLSTSIGQLAVNPSLIGLFLKTVYCTHGDTMLYDGETTSLIVKRESLKSIGSQMSSYLRWFALCRLAQDVKLE